MCPEGGGVLSSPWSVAGMDRNRTHPGRLSSAPQTVLKAAVLASTSVHERPLVFDRQPAYSVIFRLRPQSPATLAVNLAVSTRTFRGANTTKRGEAGIRA